MVRFFDDMKESVKENGVQNPILVSVYQIIDKKGPLFQYLVGERKKTFKIKKEKLFVCDTNGGTRLWAAQLENQEVPCIVQDFTKTLDFKHVCKSSECLKSHYKNPPHSISMQPYGLQISGSSRIIY